jgi:hypothetical protein
VSGTVVRHAACVGDDELLRQWCEDHASRDDFVFLTMSAPLEGGGVSLVADRRWWGALLRELNAYNTRTESRVFVIVDLDWVFVSDWGGESAEALIAELRKLIDAPPTAPVRVLVVASTADHLAHTFPGLPRLQARG